MGDRIAVLNDGELQQVGTPMELYYQPDNEFVASFIGSPSMNLTDATYEGERLSLDGFSYDLTDSHREQLAAYSPGTTLRLGIRPEDVVLVDESGPRTTEFTARIVEPMGNENVVHLTHEFGEIVATIGGSEVVRQGDRVRARLPVDNIHVFDADSGTAVFNRTRTEVTAPGVIDDDSGGRPGAAGGDRP